MCRSSFALCTSQNVFGTEDIIGPDLDSVELVVCYSYVSSFV